MAHRSTITTLLLAAALGAGVPALAQPTQPDPAPPAPDAPKQVQPVEVKDKNKEREKQAEKKPEVKKTGLGLGDKAPALEVERFLKGDPVTEFQPGKVYVVEFWASWCGPCNDAFPHVSEMQAKYKDKGVTFIGVNVAEEDHESASTIGKFVEKQGDKMAYTVAYDGKKAGTYNAYLTASGQKGIPAAFVVNKEGKIAWIGHPTWSDETHESMDSVLAKVVADKYDLSAVMAKAQAERDSAAKIKSLTTKLQRAQRTQDWDAAIAAYDELAILDKSRTADYTLGKFNMYLLKTDYPKAYALKEQVLALPNTVKNAQIFNEIAWTVVDPQGDVLPKNRDLDFALAIAQKADEASKHEDGPILDTVARCYWEKGEKQKALGLQEEAVKKADAQLKAAREANDEMKINSMEQMSSQIKETLQEYKRKLAETTG